MNFFVPRNRNNIWAVNILVLRSKLFHLGTTIRLANGLSVTDRAVLGGPKVKWLCSVSCSVCFSFIIYWVKISPHCNLPKYDFHRRISLVHGLSKQYAFKNCLNASLHANSGNNYQMSISRKTGNSEISICAIIYDTHVLVFPKYRCLVIITGTICYNSKVDTNEIKL